MTTESVAASYSYVCLFVYLSIDLSVCCLSVCLLVCQLVYLFICRSSLFLGHVYGRRFLFAYIFFLHAVVWSTLYHHGLHHHKAGHGNVH